MGTIKWLRPSGTTLETNDRNETVDYCISLGWELAKKKKKAPKKDK